MRAIHSRMESLVMQEAVCPESWGGQQCWWLDRRLLPSDGGIAASFATESLTLYSINLLLVGQSFAASRGVARSSLAFPSYLVPLLKGKSWFVLCYSNLCINSFAQTEIYLYPTLRHVSGERTQVLMGWNGTHADVALLSQMTPLGTSVSSSGKREW